MENKLNKKNTTTAYPEHECEKKLKKLKKMVRCILKKFILLIVRQSNTMATRKTKRFNNNWQIWMDYTKEYNAVTITFGAYNLITNENEDEQHIRCIYRGLRNHLRTFIHSNVTNEVEKEFILLVNENNYITPGKKYGVEIDLTAVLSNEYKRTDLWAMIELIGEEISTEATNYLITRGVQTIEKIKR